MALGLGCVHGDTGQQAGDTGLVDTRAGVVVTESPRTAAEDRRERQAPRCMGNGGTRREAGRLFESNLALGVASLHQRFGLDAQDHRFWRIGPTIES